MLTEKDMQKLENVHFNLVSVVIKAREKYAFIVTEGVRTLERQRELFAQGKSKTMNSRHLTGHAVDLAPLTKSGEPSWDWELFYPLAEAMKNASDELGVPIIWGGSWKTLKSMTIPILQEHLSPTFKDGPHFELDRSVYPETSIIV